MTLSNASGTNSHGASFTAPPRFKGVKGLLGRKYSEVPTSVLQFETVQYPSQHKQRLPIRQPFLRSSVLGSRVATGWNVEFF